MSDPVYEYTRGVGWVAYMEQRVEITLGDGTKVIVIKRDPVEGERYYCVSKHRAWTLERFCDRLQVYAMVELSHRYAHEYNDTEYDYVVVVPL